MFNFQDACVARCWRVDATQDRVVSLTSECDCKVARVTLPTNLAHVTAMPVAVTASVEISHV